MDDRTSPQQIARNDLDRFRLRNFIEELDGDELDVRNEPVDLADVAAILHGNPKAVWFRHVNGSSLQLCGNVVGSRTRLARAFGVAPDKIIRGDPASAAACTRADRARPGRSAGAGGRAHRRPTPTSPRCRCTCSTATTARPISRHRSTIASIRRTGWTNSGMRRLMLRGAHEAGVDLNAPSDLRAIYQAAAARGEKLPIAFVVGAHPIDTVSATMRIPVDELGLVASLRGGAAAGGEMPHQRHPRAGRRRIRDRGLSRRDAATSRRKGRTASSSATTAW